MNDLTILFLTANKVPQKWADYQRSVLLNAIGNTRILTFSYKPLDWGENYLQEEYSLQNIFRQFLRGAMIATTKYVAIAEDDTLYPPDHFMYRPKSISYNINRWVQLTWGEPIYFHKPRMANGLMIADRKKLIWKLQRSDGRIYELRGALHHSFNPVLCFNHPFSIDEAQREMRKFRWPVRAYDIPIWGRAEDTRKLFNG